MSIGKIGGGGENPFLKKMHEMNQAGQINDEQSSKGINTDSGVDKTSKSDEIKKPGMEEGAGSNNTDANPNAKIDKTQFTDENNIQEIDLEEFEDDFSW